MSAIYRFDRSSISSKFFLHVFSILFSTILSQNHSKPLIDTNFFKKKVQVKSWSVLFFWKSIFPFLFVRNPSDLSSATICWGEALSGGDLQQEISRLRFLALNPARKWKGMWIWLNIFYEWCRILKSCFAFFKIGNYKSLGYEIQFENGDITVWREVWITLRLPEGTPSIKVPSAQAKVLACQWPRLQSLVGVSWNDLKMTVWKRSFLSNMVIFGVHVKFRCCALRSLQFIIIFIGT